MSVSRREMKESRVKSISDEKVHECEQTKVLHQEGKLSQTGKYVKASRGRDEVDEKVNVNK